MHCNYWADRPYDGVDPLLVLIKGIRCGGSGDVLWYMESDRIANKSKIECDRKMYSRLIIGTESPDRHRNDLFIILRHRPSIVFRHEG